jgi:hypothetical protein
MRYFYGVLIFIGVTLLVFLSLIFLLKFLG